MLDEIGAVRLTGWDLLRLIDALRQLINEDQISPVKVRTVSGLGCSVDFSHKTQTDQEFSVLWIRYGHHPYNPGIPGNHLFLTILACNLTDFPSKVIGQFAFLEDVIPGNHSLSERGAWIVKELTQRIQTQRKTEKVK